MPDVNVAPRLTGRQKRAFNRARRALLDLARESDGSAYLANAMLTLLGEAAGGFIGGAAAASAASAADLHATTVKVGRLVQETAARTYARCLAEERAGEKVH